MWGTWIEGEIAKVRNENTKSPPEVTEMAVTMRLRMILREREEESDEEVEIPPIAFPHGKPPGYKE